MPPTAQKPSQKPPKATTKATSAAKHATQKPSHPQAPHTKITKQKIYFTIFVLVWTLLSTIAGQYIVALPMAMILGTRVQEPVWTLVYYILTYAITLALVLLVPPRLVKFTRERRIKPKQPSASKTKPAAATASISTEGATSSAASKSSPSVTKTDFQNTPTSLGVQHAPTFVDIGLAPIGYIVYMILATTLTSIMSLFAWFNVDQSQNVGFSYFITDLDRILAMLAIVFIAPIAEELVMRGWLYGKIREKWSVPVSILLVSLLFAILHGQWNVGVSVFALSVVLCSLREITGTIWSGMLLHILSNGIAFYLLYVAV